MDKETKESLSRLLKEFNITEDEQKFINYSDTPQTSNANHARIISVFLLTKQLKQSTEKIIASNKFLAVANDRHSKKMQYLTWALIIVGAIQAISLLVQIISAFFH